MKQRILAGLIILVLASLACSSSAPTQPADSLPTIVAATIQALTASAPQATQPAATQAVPTLSGNSFSFGNALFGNVSFVIPIGLATGATSEQVAAVDDTTGAPWDVAPAHIDFTLTGYNNSLGKFSKATISIYPAQEYATANNGAGLSLPKLQALLASPSAPLIMDSMPTVPYYNAAQQIAALMQRINFASGSGVRLVTQYGQAVGPVTNNGTFYHFQGLTNDGKYYIIAILPLGSSILSSGNDVNATEVVPAGGVTFPGYTSMDPKDYESYYQAVTDTLNKNPDSFTPSIAELDALIQSITITSQ